jgi:hypothetical protein
MAIEECTRSPLAFSLRKESLARFLQIAANIHHLGGIRGFLVHIWCHQMLCPAEKKMASFSEFLPLTMVNLMAAMYSVSSSFSRFRLIFKPLFFDCFGIITVSSLIFAGLSIPSFAQGNSYSDWTQTSGGSQIQFRWAKSSGRGCDIQLRNLDGNDRKYYHGNISYSGQGDSTQSIIIEHFYAEGDINHISIVYECSRVSDVLLTVK